MNGCVQAFAASRAEHIGISVLPLDDEHGSTGDFVGNCECVEVACGSRAAWRAESIEPSATGSVARASNQPLRSAS